jgi:hypothetical protein
MIVQVVYLRVFRRVDLRRRGERRCEVVVEFILYVYFDKGFELGLDI